MFSFLARDPVPIRFPVAGKFKFQQRGDIRFETRILGGITDSPRPDIYCKENISDLSVCDTEQKEMWIKENFCLSVDHKGRPVDIYSTALLHQLRRVLAACRSPCLDVVSLVDALMNVLFLQDESCSSFSTLRLLQRGPDQPIGCLSLVAL